MNLLLLCDKPNKGQNANTLIDHIESFSKYSSFNVYEFNPFKYKCNELDLNEFGIIVIHYSIVASSPLFLNNKLKGKIFSSQAIKVMFIQDEYRFVNKTIATINSLGIDILFTCVPNKEIEKVYPQDKLPGIEKINNLTGYVPESLKHINTKSYVDKFIDVSYRARGIPAWLGRLGKEKMDIASLFPKFVEKHNLNLNIDCTEQGRLYGSKWYKLLENSKSALGTESGASVFDFTGEIQKNVESYQAKNPNATFSKLEELFFKNEEGKIKLNQISPRCFEYAAYNVLMVLFEGEYSGILTPWKHFVPLKKDFSNINDVITAINNLEVWSKITSNAKKDLILSGKYSYSSFIELFEKSVMNHSKSQLLISTDYSKPIKLSKNISTRYYKAYVKRKLYYIFGTIFPRSAVEYTKKAYKILFKSNPISIKDTIKFKDLTKACKKINMNVNKCLYVYNINEIKFCMDRTISCKINRGNKVHNQKLFLNNEDSIDVCAICSNYIR